MPCRLVYPEKPTGFGSFMGFVRRTTRCTDFSSINAGSRDAARDWPEKVSALRLGRLPRSRWSMSPAGPCRRKIARKIGLETSAHGENFTLFVTLPIDWRRQCVRDLTIWSAMDCFRWLAASTRKTTCFPFGFIGFMGDVPDQIRPDDAQAGFGGRPDATSLPWLCSRAVELVFGMRSSRKWLIRLKFAGA